MTADASHFEVVHTGPRRFHARFKAGNGETVWVTESYTTRRAAREAIAVLVLLAATSRNRIREVDERATTAGLATPTRENRGRG